MDELDREELRSRIRAVKRELREAQDRLRIAAQATFNGDGRSSPASHHAYLDAARAVLRVEEELRALRRVAHRLGISGPDPDG